MTIIRKKIDAHLLENYEKFDTQAGFTTGSIIEDNLFTLQYCIGRSFKQRRPLIVTCLDYSESFDSISIIYDKRPSSNILNKARTNTLQLNVRNRHTNKERNCMVGDKDKKKIYITLCCTVQHTMKRGVKKHTYNSHI